MKNKIPTIAIFLQLSLSTAYAESTNNTMNCDSTCITPQSMTHKKINITTTTINAGTLSWKGQCGTAHGQTYTSPPSNPNNLSNYFCSSGRASGVATGITTYDWTCTGPNNSVAYCVGNRPYEPPPPPPTPISNCSIENVVEVPAYIESSSGRVCSGRTYTSVCNWGGGVHVSSFVNDVSCF